MILFGLGNPGNKYLLTRHNFGFMCLDLLAFNHKIRFRKARECSIAEGVIMDTPVILCKPLGFMNSSGLVVKRMLDKNFPAGDYGEDGFTVICDDLNLSLGRIKLYRRGTDGGHLGLRSIIDALDTISFPSIRLGIGPPPQTDWSEFVLDNFRDDELITVRQVLERTGFGIDLQLDKGFATAQTFLNTRNVAS